MQPDVSEGYIRVLHVLSDGLVPIIRVDRSDTFFSNSELKARLARGQTLLSI